MIREEVARLRDDMAQIAAAAPAAPMPVAVAQPESDAHPLRRHSLRMIREGRRPSASCPSPLADASEVAAVIALGLDVVPVLLGTDAAAAAVDIATAIAGEDAAIVFCDPTRPSLADFLDDEQSGFKSAIEKARARPEMLAAAALCGITSGPCEYWLPQIVEMRKGRPPAAQPCTVCRRRHGRDDGFRSLTPRSGIAPVMAGKLARPGSAKFEGLWPSPASDPEGSRKRWTSSSTQDLRGVVMQNAARALARTPAWMKVGDLKDVFLRQAKWLSATAAGGEHRYNKYFKDIEG